jgi:glycosyltransferase involved in cell wall biosynthesis
MEKVLIITYYWPPSGGAGVQRWLKFAKYLPEFGWQPVVLTVDPQYASYPQRDESLCHDVSSNCMVFYTKSFELYNLYKLIARKKEVPYGGFANESKESLFQKFSKFLRGNFLLPDPRKGWNNYAIRKAAELIKQFEIKTIVTTSPPHSTQLIGLELKKRFNIRWIADLRDPWTDIYYYHQFRHAAFARKVDRKYEQSVVENADLLITVSEDVKRIFTEKSQLPIAEKTFVIPNGFDPEDFINSSVPTGNLKVITYTGTISEMYQIDGLLKALDQMKDEWKEKLLIRFVGKIPSSIEAKFRATGLMIEFTGYVNHSQSINYLLQSDLLLLVIPKVENNRGILTGKFFEYLASQKPVLAIGPTDGDLAQMMDQTQCGQIFDYNDTDGMNNFILDKLSHEQEKTDNEQVNLFTRRELTRKIVHLF